MSASRPDLFTVIHKGLRALLFEAATEASRLDVASTSDVDALVARIECALSFLDEHAMIEDHHLLPTLRTVAPELAASLAAEHRILDELHHEVERAAESLVAADPPGRPGAAAALARQVLRLTAAHLAHMGREETEGNAALWSALEDAELAALRVRMARSVGPARHAEWVAMIHPALSPLERSLVG
jgi:hypothetical protein